MYARVDDERLRGLSSVDYLRTKFDTYRLIARGKPFPALDFAGLGDDQPRVVSSDRAGTLYLLEFWATWCGPCVAEMPRLHAAYAEINGAKPRKTKRKTAKSGADDHAELRRLGTVHHPAIESVSFSLEATPTDVTEFRERYWSMPWTHGFVGKDERRKPCSVSASSGSRPSCSSTARAILEVDGSLRGDELLPTLQRVLAGRGRGGTPPAG